jgi:hypothetical protein
MERPGGNSDERDDTCERWKERRRALTLVACAKRGILIVKEFRDMITVRGDYEGKLPLLL